jgi:hypothetical protein
LSLHDINRMLEYLKPLMNIQTAYSSNKELA